MINENVAQKFYEAACEDLNTYCYKEADLNPIILDNEYPFRVQFIPDGQVSIYELNNVDENGEVNDLTITVGLTTTVKSTLKFKMDSKLLKKLIKKAEKLGTLYYQAFREAAGNIQKNNELGEVAQT